MVCSTCICMHAHAPRAKAICEHFLGNVTNHLGSGLRWITPRWPKSGLSGLTAK